MPKTARQSGIDERSLLLAELFLLVIPVLRAKETLAREKIRKRKMKEYVERVGKTIQEAE
jgi:hypothetical protein